MAGGNSAHELITTPGVHELFSLLNVTVVVVAVIIFARKAIVETFKNRSQKLRTDLVQAREELKKISQEIELSRLSLANIEKEKAELINTVEGEAKQLAARLVAEAQAAAIRIREDATRAGSAEYSDMRAKLKSDVLDQLMGKVREEFSSENSQQKLHDRLVESFVSQSESLSKEVNAGELR